MKSHEKALEQKIKSQRKNLEALEKEVSSASIASSVGTGSEVEERDEAPDGRPRASSVGTFSPPPEHKLAVRVREGEQDTSPVVRPRSNSSVS